MDNRADVLIVGAGMAGIACARVLQGAGRSVLLLDKGRGIGGRMATKRVGLDGVDIRFDHGAQQIGAEAADFAALIAGAGAVVWDDGAGHRVGYPGMSAVPKALAQGLDVRQSVEVTGLTQDGGAWQVQAGDAVFRATRVVLAIPAPQAARLLGTAHPWVSALSAVEMAPCLTLMAAFAPGSPRPFHSRQDTGHPLAWIAQNSSKPGRGDAAVTWVAQAGAAWSRAHLGSTPDEIRDMMLPMLCDVLGVAPDTALVARTHRWRFGLVTRALGQPFLGDAAQGLYLGGDWCLGARVEDAWHSGEAIARDILAGDAQIHA